MIDDQKQENSDDARSKASPEPSSHHSQPIPFLGLRLRTLLLLITGILILRWSIISPYHVPTPSMEPTIKIGDRLLAYKAAYTLKIPFSDRILFEFGRPARGDIVIFRYPKNPNESYVKRVIAIGGDEIQIIEDTIYVNGTPLLRQQIDSASSKKVLHDVADKEQKLLYSESIDGKQYFITQDREEYRRMGPRTFPSNQTEAFHVQPNTVFVIGDNRDRSEDSRTWLEVPLDNIIGQAKIVLWSIYDPGINDWPTYRWDRMLHFLQ
jgi:signal peptidase I